MLGRLITDDPYSFDRALNKVLYEFSPAFDGHWIKVLAIYLFRYLIHLCLGFLIVSRTLKRRVHARINLDLPVHFNNPLDSRLHLDVNERVLPASSLNRA